MTGISFHREVVTRLRAPVAGDRYGDEARNWDAAAELDIPGGRVVPQAGAENAVGRDQIVRRWTYYGPYDADLLASDRVRYAGDVYEIDGEVRRWRSASGNLAHLECDLLLVQG